MPSVPGPPGDEPAFPALLRAGAWDPPAIADFRIHRRSPVPRPPIPKARPPLRWPTVPWRAPKRRRTTPRAARSELVLRAQREKTPEPSRQDPALPANRRSRAKRWRWAPCAWVSPGEVPQLQRPDAATGAPTSLPPKDTVGPEIPAHNEPRAGTALRLPKPPRRFHTPAIA